VAKYYYREFKNRLKTGQLKNVYYFHGEEAYLQEEAVNLIEKSLSENPVEKLLLYGSTFNLNDFLILAESSSLFGGKRLIVVKDANKIKNAAEKTLITLLEENAGRILYDACLVFVNPTKISKVSAIHLRSAAGLLGDIVDFYPPYKNEIRSFISSYLGEHGRTITSADADYLIETAGENMYDIKNELDKLMLFSEGANPIIAADIAKCSGETAVENIFNLTGAIMSKNLKMSLKTLERLLSEGTETMLVLNHVFYSFKKLLLCPDAGNFTRREIYNKMKLIYDAEYSLKSGGQLNSELRVLVASLCD